MHRHKDGVARRCSDSMSGRRTSFDFVGTPCRIHGNINDDDQYLSANGGDL